MTDPRLTRSSAGELQVRLGGEPAEDSDGEDKGVVSAEESPRMVDEEPPPDLVRALYRAVRLCGGVIVRQGSTHREESA